MPSHLRLAFLQQLDQQSTNSTVTKTIEMTLSIPLTLSVVADTQLKVGKEQFTDAQKSEPP